MAEKSDEFIISRVFDAPRERVWKAWTEAERLKQWWGPAGFTNPVCKVDARQGGAIRIEEGWKGSLDRLGELLNTTQRKK